jgi:hypothetical protein
VYYEILDFHGGDYEQYCLLGLDDKQFGRCVPILQANHLPPFSGYKGPERGYRSCCTLVPVYRNTQLHPAEA